MPAKGKKSEQDAAIEAQLAELSPEQVLKLLDTLAEKEKAKLDARKARRREKSTDVEKDW